MITLTSNHLKKLLNYDPTSGEFRWRVSRGCMSCNVVAGRVMKDGYRRILIDSQPYVASRLAWFYVHGYWPGRDLDHKNRIRSDDRIENLREATASQNNANSKLRCNNTSGYRGVSWNRRKGKFRAYVSVDRKQIHLGFFYIVERAAAVAKLARIEHFGEFSS